MAIPADTLNDLLDRMWEELPEFFRTDPATTPAPSTRPADGSTRVYSDAYLKRFLGVAGNIHGKYPICTVYAAAHLITLAQSTGGDLTEATVDGGVRLVKQIETGDMLVEYEQGIQQSGSAGSSTGRDQTFWGQSHYGRTFLTLEARLLVPTFLVF